MSDEELAEAIQFELDALRITVQELSAILEEVQESKLARPPRWLGTDTLETTM